MSCYLVFFFFFQAEDGIRDRSPSRGLGDVYKRQIIDIGEENDIHPRNKQDVGKRLALHALHNDYGYNSIVCTGPIFQSVKRIGDALEVTFNACDEQLVARNKYGYLSGFAIAGADGKYQWAQAKIENNKGIVCLLYTSDAADEEDK